MDNYGFIRVAACSPRVKVADIEYNTSEIISAIDKAESKGVIKKNTASRKVSRLALAVNKM